MNTYYTVNFVIKYYTVNFVIEYYTVNLLQNIQFL